MTAGLRAKFLSIVRHSMTEIKASDGKFYISAIFDCYDLAVSGLAMDTNMKAGLC